MEEIETHASGGRCTITINRPEAHNALTPGMLDALSAAIDRAENDDDIGVVVITGAGRAFSAGVDLKSLGERKIENGAVGPVFDVPGRGLIQRIESVPKVVIARVNGYCFTGALELALACDLIVAAAEATFGDTHVKFGIRPSWGMSQRLPRRVGMLKARELSYTARTFSGAEALSMGLVNAAPPLGELDAAVDALCERILANSPGAVAAYKDLYRRTEGMRLDEGLDYEARTGYDIGDAQARIASFSKS
ncbi:MAG: enoyl-CoA hydratase/isomerase family protein [Gammaproteobacteria bacterium]|nr:enoyl-CoA hydratase/isomerase family protein [Gammaproteobacteria bacterium]